ncbi:MAG: hypothetical protein DMF08_03430 [Verrucomicrobia bacterium]|nr:MAG: hypothetical protein DMF08_03430 [Verrucomicrobiota bacterium]PYL11833.1 MAG: hypothetical protein DMF48_04850 [Verrucomicrobiota bacterium]PYL51004.1 MAG: hypothetical protein DMF32_02430 [Verrucomicrobiota bacterium]
MKKNVTTLRARFTLASGAFFRKRFLGEHACGVLVAAFCRNELSFLNQLNSAVGNQYKSSRWQNAIAARCKRAFPQKALALRAKHD